LGTWEGIIDLETAVWLHFFDNSGNLVLLPEEAADKRVEQNEQAEQERQLNKNANELNKNINEPIA